MSRRLDFQATVDRARSHAGPNGACPWVVQIDPVTDARWDDYVASHRGASAYHLGAWAEILRRAYRFKPAYLALEDSGGALSGVLPLMWTRGLVTGRRLRSLPVVPPAGPLADSADGVRTLLSAACRLTDEWGSVWTLHSREGDHQRLCPDLQPVPKYPTWVLELPQDVDEMRRGWKKTANNLFRSIRKADRAGVTVREGTTESDLRAFYGLYARTMRRRTTLPRPYAQLAADRELLGPAGAFKLLVAEHEGEIVAGGVFHSFGAALDLLYNGSDESRLDVRPNHALYWHAVEWAAQNGKTELDFGHAREGSSLARFKAQWGAAEVPEYRYDYVPGRAGVDLDADPKGRPAVLQGRGRRGPIERVWPRLPIAVTRLAGRIAYRYL